MRIIVWEDRELIINYVRRVILGLCVSLVILMMKWAMDIMPKKVNYKYYYRGTLTIPLPPIIIIWLSDGGGGGNYNQEITLFNFDIYYR